MEKWLKTLQKAQPTPPKTTTRYRKGTQHNVYDELIDGEKQWSYRDETFGGSVEEKIEQLHLLDEDGLSAAREAGVLGDLCYHGELVLRRPTLKCDNAHRIAHYIPSVFTSAGVVRYVLGYGAFCFNKARRESTFSCFIVDADAESFTATEERPCIPYFPDTAQRVVLKNAFTALSVTKTPEWIYGTTSECER